MTSLVDPAEQDPVFATDALGSERLMGRIPIERNGLSPQDWLGALSDKEYSAWHELMPFCFPYYINESAENLFMMTCDGFVRFFTVYGADILKKHSPFFIEELTKLDTFYKLIQKSEYLAFFYEDEQIITVDDDSFKTYQQTCRLYPIDKETRATVSALRKYKIAKTITAVADPINFIDYINDLRRIIAENDLPEEIPLDESEAYQ